MNLLIVDDSKMILKMSYDILVNNNIDANILSCESGYLAFDMLKEQNIDVILLDIVMPNYTGIEVLKDLKEGGYLDKIRVLMFSSLSDKYVLRECFELGAFDYILKPLEPIEFISRVNNALTDQRLRMELSQSLEAKIKQNKQLEDLNLKLKETQAELIHKEQMAGIGRLAAGIAHEINNPLGFISSNIETLKEYMGTFKLVEELFTHIIINSFNDLPDAIKERIENEVDAKKIKFIKEDLNFLFEDTNEGLERVKHIVNGLKNFSSIEKTENLHFYNLSESIENIVNITLGQSLEDIKLETELENTPDILAYGSELNQSLLNIIRNAIHAVTDKGDTENGQVNISVKSDDGYVYCIVEDNGVGIPEDLFSDILKPFFTTRSIGSGTGLGLSIAYDIIVTKHSGALDIESKVGEGTKVIVKLPRFSSDKE